VIENHLWYCRWKPIGGAALQTDHGDTSDLAGANTPALSSNKSPQTQLVPLVERFTRMSPRPTALDNSSIALVICSSSSGCNS
jgi:hypothetical protein